MRTALIGGILVALSAGSALAQAPDRALAGTLECNVSEGIGFIFGSTRTLGCTFNRNGGPPEHYVGRINRFGVDLGVTGPSVILWQVFASSDAPGRFPLAGTYAGVGAEATAGVGLGANALIGGSNQTVALQPIDVSAQTGLNVAAGIAEIQLDPAP
jgi:hypothetical protein